MKKIIVANGVNLDLLGKRNPQVYTSFTLQELEKYLQGWAKKLFSLFDSSDWQLVFFQTNVEHEFLTEISKGWQGAVLNPGAWTHTSIALRDRLEALSLSFVEVHISNLAGRESFRKKSYIAKYAVGSVSGFGMSSYLAGLTGLLSHLCSSTGGSSSPS